MSDGILKKRFVELSHKAREMGIFLFSDFLGLAEQSDFFAVARQMETPVKPFGGAAGCERVMLRFGDEEELGYTVPYPIVCLAAEPKDRRFAETLTHRDCLGALMNLGIERDVLGDIAILGGTVYIFCEEKIAPFIESELKRIRHTDVKITRTDSIPEGELYRTERICIQANGERIDAVIAKVYNLSREEALELFRRGLVFVGGRECTANAYTPKAGEVISVRGYGRMIYRGYETLSRKGKLNIVVEKYI